MVDDEGIRGFYWEYGFVIEGVASANQKLMPMAQMKETISEQIFAVHRDMFDNSGLQWIFNVDRIQLEYAKMPHNGDFKDARLVPVWNVYMVIKTENEEDEDGGALDEPRVLLTVNAIDGSVT